MLTFTAIGLLTFYTGLRVYKRSRDKEIKLLSLVVLLGLTTYYVHGLMNNFLDTDKSSVPFWAFTAMIVAMDIFHTDKTEEDRTQPQEG